MAMSGVDLDTIIDSDPADADMLFCSKTVHPNQTATILVTLAKVIQKGKKTTENTHQKKKQTENIICKTISDTSRTVLDVWNPVGVSHLPQRDLCVPTKQKAKTCMNKNKTLGE